MSIWVSSCVAGGEKERKRARDGYTASESSPSPDWTKLHRLASKVHFQLGDLGLQRERVIGRLLERECPVASVVAARWPLATREADLGGSGLFLSCQES